MSETLSLFDPHGYGGVEDQGDYGYRLKGFLSYFVSTFSSHLIDLFSRSVGVLVLNETIRSGYQG